MGTLEKKNQWFMVGALILTIVALTIAVIVLGVLLGKKETDSNICLTKACISSANLILKNLDITADPCEDFNRFSCGTFIDKTRIPDDASSDDTFSLLRINLAFAVADALERPLNASEPQSTKNAKRFYASCLNETIIESNGLEYFKNMLTTELGGWPLINLGTFDQNRDPMEFMYALHKVGARPIFYVGVDRNPKNPEYSTLEVGQGSWFFDRQYYSDTKVMAAYQTYVTTVITKMTNQPIDKTKIDAMIQLENKFAQYLYNVSERRNQTYKNTTLGELKAETGFDWPTFVKTWIFKDYPLVQADIKDTEMTLANEWYYLKNASTIFTDALTTNREALNNLMIWSFVKEKTGYLPKEFKDARLDFDKVYTGATATVARSRTCANAALDRMPYAVGRLYVSENFDSNSKKAVEDMVQNIRDEFRKILTKVDWMDTESKKEAYAKADSIDVKMAYPDFTYNDTYLDNLYKELTFDETKYLENAIKSTKSSFKETFSKLREKTDRKEWISGPAVVNAFYSPPANQICFPAGILQAPFFDSLSPNYLNYGGIGSVIGHEITHGFDDQGRQYDKDGIFYPDDTIGLWSNKTIANYKQKAKCIIDQYSNYVAKQVNMSIKGDQTQGENIADNGGIKEAFGAYQAYVAKNGPEKLLPGLEKYTQNQLFFINYAQVWCSKYRDPTLRSRIITGVHSPGEFRIRGPTSNYDEFRKAFNCKANQGNNPENKCAVW